MLMSLKQLFKIVSLSSRLSIFKKTIKEETEQFQKSIVHENISEIEFETAYYKKEIDSAKAMRHIQ